MSPIEIAGTLNASLYSTHVDLSFQFLSFFVLEYVQPVVVGVVGIGHLPGIKENWDKQLSVQEIQRIMR